MLYVALGDSISYGYSSTRHSRSFPQRIARSLSQAQKVNVYLQAKPGWTSRQLLKSLDAVQPCIWDEAKLVTLMVGGNDLLRASPWALNGNHGYVVRVADRYHQNLCEIVERAKRPQSKFIISTLYNPFPNSLVAEEYTALVNNAVRRVAKKYGLILVELDKAMSGKEARLVDGYKRGTIKDFRLRGNPIHPNDAGHAVIASKFVSAYRNASQRQTQRVLLKKASKQAQT